MKLFPTNDEEVALTMARAQEISWEQVRLTYEESPATLAWIIRIVLAGLKMCDANFTMYAAKKKIPELLRLAHDLGLTTVSSRVARLVN